MPQSPTKSRVVFYVSDRTGLTAETYGRSLLSQFPGFEFESQLFSFVDSEQKAQNVLWHIQKIHEMTGLEPIVFTTLVKPGVQKVISDSQACVVDLFNTFIEPLEDCLGNESVHTLGMSQSVFGKQAYQNRLDAIDYAINHDDGVRPDQYSHADIILVGVSRCGKTPTSLYLAMNFFLKAANYPLTDQDLERDELPDLLRPLKDRLVALTIQPKQLSQIRQQRRPNSEYASLVVCQREVKAAEMMFRSAGLPVFDTTYTSIEEIAGWVIRELPNRRFE